MKISIQLKNAFTSSLELNLKINPENETTRLEKENRRLQNKVAALEKKLKKTENDDSSVYLPRLSIPSTLEFTKAKTPKGWTESRDFGDIPRYGVTHMKTPVDRKGSDWSFSEARRWLIATKTRSILVLCVRTNFQPENLVYPSLQLVKHLPIKGYLEGREDVYSIFQEIKKAVKNMPRPITVISSKLGGEWGVAASFLASTAPDFAEFQIDYNDNTKTPIAIHTDALWELLINVRRGIN